MKPFDVPEGWEFCNENEATHVYDDYNDEVIFLTGNDRNGIVVGKEDDVMIEEGFDSDRYYPVKPLE